MVTATLADFRGLDTLGEITVVALVLLGVATLLGGMVPAKDRGSDGAAEAVAAARVVTRAVARLLYLPTFVVAAALLVKGFVETGDGFSAGVVAALGVLLRYLAFGHEGTKGFPPVRHAIKIAFAGLIVALGVAAVPLLLGDAPLTHYPGSEPVHLGTIELMTAVVFDAGIFALVFGFARGGLDLRPRHGRGGGVRGAARRRRGELTLYAAVMVSVVFASGTFLLQRDLLRVMVGIILISNSATLFIISSGLTMGEPPIYPLGGSVSDPLVQSMALTALVIGFGVAALLLAMVYRLYVSHRTVDLEEIADFEMRQAEALERGDDPGAEEVPEAEQDTDPREEARTR